MAVGVFGFIAVVMLLFGLPFAVRDLSANYELQQHGVSATGQVSKITGWSLSRVPLRAMVDVRPPSSDLRELDVHAVENVEEGGTIDLLVADDGRLVKAAATVQIPSSIGLLLVYAVGGAAFGGVAYANLRRLLASRSM